MEPKIREQEQKKGAKVAAFAGALAIICLVVSSILASSFLDFNHLERIEEKTDSGEIDTTTALTIFNEYIDYGELTVVVVDYVSEIFGNFNAGSFGALSGNDFGSLGGSFLQGSNASPNSDFSFPKGKFDKPSSSSDRLGSLVSDFVERDGLSDIYKVSKSTEIFKIYDTVHYVAFALGIASIFLILCAAWKTAIFFCKSCCQSRNCIRLNCAHAIFLLVALASLALIIYWLVISAIFVGAAVAISGLVALTCPKKWLFREKPAAEETTP